MTTIKYRNGKNEVHNEAGYQVEGSPAAGLNGLNPKELLEASLGLCVSLTLTHLLKRDNIEVGESGIDVEVTSKKDEGGANRFSNFTVKVKFPEGLSDEYKEKAKVIIERGCTIGNTLKNSSLIELIEL